MHWWRNVFTDPSAHTFTIDNFSHPCSFFHHWPTEAFVGVGLFEQISCILCHFVTFATNYEQIFPLSTCAHRDSGLRVILQQPEIVQSHYSSMGWVDLFDQNLATYRISLRAKSCTDSFLSKCWMQHSAMHGYFFTFLNQQAGIEFQTNCGSEFPEK